MKPGLFHCDLQGKLIFKERNVYLFCKVKLVANTYFMVEVNNAGFKITNVNAMSCKFFDLETNFYNNQ